MRKKIVDENRYGRIQANLGDETGDCSLQESSIRKKESIQNLIKEIKAIVFEKDELEFREMSNSDVEIKFYDI